ncbi:MAG: hypothetical protein QXN55_00850 [Candidatus Nitrosotenuis sp.]
MTIKNEPSISDLIEKLSFIDQFFASLKEQPRKEFSASELSQIESKVDLIKAQFESWQEKDKNRIN